MAGFALITLQKARASASTYLQFFSDKGKSKIQIDDCIKCPLLSEFYYHHNMTHPNH